MSIGTIIRKIRKSRGLKQSEIGVSQGHLSEVERGSVLPCLDFVDTICFALSVPDVVLFAEARLISGVVLPLDEEKMRLTDLCEYYRREHNYSV